MMNNSVFPFLFCMILFVTSSAQSQDCKIYETVLGYLNKNESVIKYGYTGTINPESSELGERVDLSGQQLSFYIVKKKSDFDYYTIRDWFSKFIKDSTLNQYQYTSSQDSILNCSFSCCLKYQYRSFEETRKFTETDFSIEVKGNDTIHYTPVRITFSKILYSKNTALVYAKTFAGLGGGRDITVYGFVFKKKGKDWILKKSEVETR
jgi:hypothetical protein